MVSLRRFVIIKKEDPSFLLSWKAGKGYLRVREKAGAHSRFRVTGSQAR